MVNFLSKLTSGLNQVQSTINRAGSAVNQISGFVNQAGSIANQASNLFGNAQNFIQNFANPPAYMQQVRLGTLPVGAEYSETTQSYGNYSFTPSTSGNDWRVRIELPKINSFQTSPLMQPLVNSNGSLVFPVTPQILVQHVANYTPMSPTHSNYSFPIYSNSSVEDITISCEWPVENESDGAYWVASVHFLRTVTKMFYGNSPLRGAPPPICYLNGYGDYIFKQMPVVIKMFSMDLNQDIDYIKVPVGSNGFDSQIAQTAGGYTYVPTLGRITVVVTPAYSRDEVRQFNLDQFAKSGQGGFI